jgi:predicted Ser/Thr protein kinase
MTALQNLEGRLTERKPSKVLSFDEFLQGASQNPTGVLRNIFGLVYDMVHHYVPDPEIDPDPESIGFLDYDLKKMLVEDCDNPFFADQVFANRFMSLIGGLRQGERQDRIYMFEGSHGSGKSTFLNNFLQKFEEFTQTNEGEVYETVWNLDLDRSGGEPGCVQEDSPAGEIKKPNRNFMVACPNHDSPILQLPVSYRHDLLSDIIPDGELRERLFEEKANEWIFKKEPCTICNSIYDAVLDRVGSEMKVLSAVNARRRQFSRKLGTGISVFNTGDLPTEKALTNRYIHERLKELFQGDVVDYIYSRLAQTNDGIYALMDVKKKSHNAKRLVQLHGIISDRVHKVMGSEGGDLEERVESLFIGLINPEDISLINDVASLRDRVQIEKINYVLDYDTEVEIYKNKFGGDVEEEYCIQPGVLQTFAKAVISTRLNLDTSHMEKWIDNPEDYSPHIDDNFLLLKMDLYRNVIPGYISSGDKQRFTRDLRKKIMGDSINEGVSGVSGRQSLKLFFDFLSRFSNNGHGLVKDKIIGIGDVVDYFKTQEAVEDIHIPGDFLEDLVSKYDWEVTQQFKDCMFDANEEEVSRQIQNYIFATNYEGSDVSVVCSFTGDTLNVSEDFFRDIEYILLDDEIGSEDQHRFRKIVQSDYLQEILQEGIPLGKIKETDLYKRLIEKYSKNLKEYSIVPLMDPDGLEARAIKEFDTPEFDSYDRKVKDNVNSLMSGLQTKFGYTAEGAKKISCYLLDKELPSRY